MSRLLRNLVALVVPAFVFAGLFWSFFSAERTASAAVFGENSGSLQIIGKGGVITGACPLKHTEVRGAISGFLARVKLRRRLRIRPHRKSKRYTLFRFQRMPLWMT